MQLPLCRDHIVQPAQLQKNATNTIFLLPLLPNILTEDVIFVSRHLRATIRLQRFHFRFHFISQAIFLQKQRNASSSHQEHLTSTRAWNIGTVIAITQYRYNAFILDRIISLDPNQIQINAIRATKVKLVSFVIFYLTFNFAGTLVGRSSAPLRFPFKRSNKISISELSLPATLSFCDGGSTLWCFVFSFLRSYFRSFPFFAPPAAVGSELSPGWSKTSLLRPFSSELLRLFDALADNPSDCMVLHIGRIRRTEIVSWIGIACTATRTETLASVLRFFYIWRIFE